MTFRGVDPKQQKPWPGVFPWRSSDTAAQYMVPLCQEQLPDANPIWHRVQPMSHHVSQHRNMSSANINLPEVAQRKDSQVLPVKSYLILAYQTF